MVHSFDRSKSAVILKLHGGNKVKIHVDKSDETLDHLARDMVKAADAVDAEMDAAAAKLHGLEDKVSADFNANAAKIKSNVTAFKAKIVAKRKDASTNAQAFESEFSEGWHQIVAFFKNLK